jgi:hypothetical protein
VWARALWIDGDIYTETFDWFSFVCSDAMRKMELVASSTGSEPQISHASDTPQKWNF